MALRIAVAVAAVVLGYLGVRAVQVCFTSRTSEPHPVSAVVVMGAAQYDGRPSPDFEARLAEAKELWRARDAPLVVVTGSKEPGDVYTESQAGVSWLRRQGVPADDLLQAGGNDSWANLADASRVLADRGIRRVLVVTDGFHEDRSLAIATDLGMVASPVPAARSPITGWSAVPYFAKETFGVAVGRIIG